jgi:hypothetical protein
MRARWYSASNARWERLDPFEGNPTDPFSFNKYGFVHGNPVMGADPTGWYFSAGGMLSGMAIGMGMTAMTIGAMSIFGPRVDKPSFGQSLIPVLGSAWSAIYDFQNGSYFMGAVHSAIAVSDWFLVGAAIKFVGKSLFKIGARESAEVIYTRISEEGFEHFIAKEAAGETATFVSKTEGAVYGAAIENAPLWRTMAGMGNAGSGKMIEWVGPAAQIFNTHGVSGWYSGLKNLLGQYKTTLGNVEMLSFVREGDTIICYAARITPKVGTDLVKANLKVLGRWVGIDYGVGRIPAAAEAVVEKWLGQNL